MGTTLATLSPPAGARHKRKRIGRGPGSGNGRTAGHGEKGQKARSGGGIRVGFEGGQMPLQRRLPKRGFKNRFRVEYTPVNLGQLAAVFGAGEQVDANALKSKGMIPRKALRFKVLATGDLPHALNIIAQGASKSAAEKVTAAGGTLEIVAPVVRRAANRTQEGK